MSVFSWLKRRVSAKHKAGWLYRRGLMHARLHQHEEAIADYTAVIDMLDIPGDLRATALYNRALVHHAVGDDASAAHDLHQILETADAANDVKTEARRKLVRMERATDRTNTREPPSR